MQARSSLVIAPGLALGLALGLASACSATDEPHRPPPPAASALAPAALVPTSSPGSHAAPAQAGVPSGAPPAAPAAPATAACPPRPACDAPMPALARRDFQRKRSSATTSLGPPRHRGRDLFLRPGKPQWAIGKFAYGPADKDLSSEEVDVWLLRGCGATWEKVGTFTTTNDEGGHPPVLGIEDKGGHVFVELSKVTRPLDVGRHRVRMVVAGDLSATDLFIEVLPPGARVAVSDVDGTLTESEAAIADEVITGDDTAAHPGAADAMSALASRGYHLFYLTARPDWLVPATRAWLTAKGFPPGILHTTTTATGVGGDAAAAFKSAELAALKAELGIVPEPAFGNMPSDVTTYGNAGIKPSRCYYYKLDGDLRGGVRHEDYRALVPAFSALPPSCP